MPKRKAPKVSETPKGGTITTLEVQKRNKQRVNVYIDDVYSFSLALDEAALLRRGQQLSTAEIEALKDRDALHHAVDLSAKFLGLRPRSEAEVRRKLTEKEMPQDLIERALEKLREMGYVDDLSFAKFWIQERSNFKPTGPRALRYELQQKGVARNIIDEVLAEGDADDDAYRAALSQSRKLRRLTKREFQDKMLAFLQRRGFSFSTAKSAVQRLIEEIETPEDENAVPADFFAPETHKGSDWE